MDTQQLHDTFCSALEEALDARAASFAPLGGRAGPVGTIKAVHLFGSLATPTATLDNLVDFDRAEAPWIEDCDGPAEGLFSIQTIGREIQRVTADSVGPLTQTQVINGAPLPAGVSATVTDTSRIKFRLRLDTAMGPRTVLVDAGQPLEVYAERVSVERLVPANFQEVPPEGADGSVANRSGLVIDSIVGCRIMRIEAPIGHKDALLTQFLNVDADSQPSIVRPPGARSVVIYQTASGTASSAWTQTYGLPGAGLTIANLPFIGTSRRTEQESLLPNCTHLQTDLDADNDRFFTLVWTIRP